MEQYTLNDFLANGKFKYNRNVSPKENYQYFQQSISFSQGVEFLSSDNINGKSFLYLYDLPGLNCNLTEARGELKSFNKEIIAQLNDIINTEENAFVIYAAIYDLFKEVQEDLKHPVPVDFLAIERVMQNSSTMAEIRKKNIPLVRGARKGAFVKESHQGFSPISFEDLGSKIKDYIIKVFKLRQKSKEMLFDELSDKITWLFNKKKYFKHYQYSGDIADIVEIAVLLHGQMGVFGKKNLTIEQFAKDLASMLGMHFSRLSDQSDTLIKRKAHRQLLIQRKLKELSDYIDHLKD